MMALAKILAGGVFAAALVSAAPAAAQYYPGYGGYGGGYGGYSGGYGGYGGYGGGYGGYGGGYGYNSQALISQCVAAVQRRLGGYGYGYNQYGYGGGYRGGRVLGISRVEPRQEGGFNVRGVATSGRYGGGYGGYGGQGQVDLTWKCKTDYRGYIVDIDVNRAQPAYGNGYNGYSPYNNYNYDYSQYGYRRY